MAGIAFNRIFKIPEKTEEIKTPETIITVGAELIKSEISFLLTTERHSLFFGNNIGADLEQYLYLMNSRATYNLIKDELEQIFLKYKKVYLNKVDMEFNNINKTLEIKIDVSTDSQGLEIIEIPLTLGG